MDPLSPYLFLFVADALSALIKRKVLEGSLEELRISRGAPGVSHLLFADDTLLFFKATQQQAREVKELLDTYARGTGQLINPAKCSSMFNEKGQNEDYANVKNMLGIERKVFEAKYLGLPTHKGRIKGTHFQDLRERLCSERFMSSAAKETLIKLVCIYYECVQAAFEIM